MSPSFSPCIAAAVDAARRAASMLASAEGRDDVQRKGPRDFVTATDTAIERMMRDVATSVGVAVVGEEYGGEAPSGTPYWLVDPLCGTGNYADGLSLVCSNIAVVCDGEILAGVVAEMTGKVIAAERGQGAWHLSPTGAQPLRTNGNASRIVAEPGRSTGAQRAVAARLARQLVLEDQWDVLALHSTVAMAYVASGFVAGYVVCAPAGLHLAAGVCLVEEAGGMVRDLDGARWTLDARGVVAAADEAALESLLRTIRSAQ